MSGRRIGGAIVTTVLLASLAAAAPPAQASTGEVQQLPGTAGCVSEPPANPECAFGRVLDDATDVVVSADGRSVYVSSEDKNGVSVFDRNAATGALTQKLGVAGCVTDDGTDGKGGGCTDGSGLSEPSGLAVSPDGRSLYVASAGSDAVAILDRDTTTGVLSQKPGSAGCVSDSGSSGACVAGSGLDDPTDVAVSADGRSVYVTSRTSSALATLDRDTTTGALTPAGCVCGGLGNAEAVAVSADGESVYLVAPSEGRVFTFGRDTATGALTLMPDAFGPLAGPRDVTVSPDGRSVYVAGEALFLGNDGSVTIFDRDTTTGALTAKPGLAGCISDDGQWSTDAGAGPCVDGRGLLGAEGVTVSPDGLSVYVAAFSGNGMAVFDRDPVTGALTQKSGPAGCVNLSGSDGCAPANATIGPRAVAVSPDNRSVYVVGTPSQVLTGSAVAVFARGPFVDLGMSVRASAAQVDPGDPITFKLRAVNEGPDPAPGVKITATLPNTLTIVSMTSACSATGQTVTCVVPRTLAVGATATPAITVTSSQVGTRTVSATVTSTGISDLDASDDTGAREVSVGPIAQHTADLRVSMTANMSPSGLTLFYRLRTDNFGPDTATGIVAKLTLPPGFTISRIEQGGCTHDAGTNVVTCPVGKRASGRSSTQQISATTPEVDDDTTFTTTATVSAPQSDPNLANNSASRTDLVWSR